MADVSKARVPSGAGVWLYPWDLLDLGPERVADTLAAMGVAEAYLTASYHTVHVLSRVNPGRRMVHAPRPALYFRHDPALWDGLDLRPERSPLVEEQADALEAARDPFHRAGVGLVAWTVCLHGPPQASPGPTARVVSPLGGHVDTAVCVRHPQVRAFARALVHDVGARSDRVQLEAAHWVPGPHHQHAKFDTGEPALAELLAAWCVCEHCLAAVAELGGDPERLVRALGQAAERVLAERSPTDAMDRAQALGWLGSTVADLDALLIARRGAVTALACDLRDASPAPIEFVSMGDPDLTGVDAAALDAAGIPLRHLAYGPPEQVAERLAGLTSAGVQPARTGLGLSMLAADNSDEASLRRCITMSADAGFASIGFYNYGLVPPRRHDWLRAALDDAGLAEAHRP